MNDRMRNTIEACMYNILSTLGLFVGFSSLAYGQEAPPIVNGQETSEFIQVGVILAYDANSGGAAFCSGTLIHEEWVVTAAHCVEAVDDYITQGFDIYFMLGDDLYSDTGIEYYSLVDSTEIHPEYSASSTSLSSDIGLLFLQDPITDVEVMALNEVVPTDTWIGEYIDYVGWGVTSDNGWDSGIKRYTAIPYNTSDEMFLYSYDPNTNLCSGDSGGAAMRWVEGEGYYLVGVNSFVFSVQGSDPCVGGASGATRIDVYFDWIRQYVPEPPPPVVEEEDTGIEDSEKTMLCAVGSWQETLWLMAVGLCLVGYRRQK